MVLDGLPGLYGFKYDGATACGLPLYLYSYKLVGSATTLASAGPIVREVVERAKTGESERKGKIFFLFFFFSTFSNPNSNQI